MKQRITLYVDQVILKNSRKRAIDENKSISKIVEISLDAYSKHQIDIRQNV